jgi:hypothetical protein
VTEDGESRIQFVGGASGPSRTGVRVHASWPLVALSVKSGELQLRGRGPGNRIFKETVVDPATVTIQPIRGPFLGGVSIRVANGDSWLFWTGKRQEVLAALSANGAQTVGDERRVSWRDAMGY